MQFTDRDIQILLAVVRYYVVNRPQIQQLFFPEDSSGRATRRRLAKLVAENFISRSNLVVHHPQAGSPGRIYYPAQRGCEFLAEHFADESFLATPTQAPQAHHVFHWLEVTETHIALDAAIAAQSAVALDGFLNEWDTVNKDAARVEDRYRIYTLLRDDPKLVCAPDAAFLLSVAGHRKVFYLERDRNTSGVKRIAASKTPGYAELARRGWQTRHFATATVPTFSVLMVAPTPRRRDGLCKAIAEKDGAELWKFAAADDLTPDQFLHAPIWHPCSGDPVSLLKAPSGSSGERS